MLPSPVGSGQPRPGSVRAWRANGFVRRSRPGAASPEPRPMPETVELQPITPTPQRPKRARTVSRGPVPAVHLVTLGCQRIGNFCNAKR